MVHACEACTLLFSRPEKVKECPFCEKKHIRGATPEEI